VADTVVGREAALPARGVSGVRRASPPWPPARIGELPLDVAALEGAPL